MKMLQPVNYFGTTLVVCSVIYLANIILSTFFENESSQVDEWLDQNDLGDYKKLFKDNGISTLSGCSTPEQLERLPELPAAEEKRLRRAAQILQHRLVLRQWLSTHKLQHVYSKLLSLDVTSLDDVYWLEDRTARTVLDPKDFSAWSSARQSLPTGKEQLQTLKSDLWSTVVKNNKHQDAWAWGGMLVVSISVCGLVTLAAMTQPSLAPEAKHSLLQYVTGKYLHPPSCKVEWGWSEPVTVGDTMSFTVLCFQRNQQPYPICDTDQLAVLISHGSRKVTAVVELGSGDPARAHTARVHFSVRTSGVYIISILIGGVSACGGPFRKSFLAAAAAGAQCRVAGGAGGAARGAGGGARGAVLLAAGSPRTLLVLPRDVHDNHTRLCNASDFSISISPLGGEVDPQLSSCAQFSYDTVNERITLQITLEAPGIYRADVFYQGVLVRDGELELIVLTARDAATIQRNLTSPRHHTTFEARLLGARARKVILSLSPKQLTVSDYFLKFIPKRITAFRLSPSTKVILSPPPPDAESPAGAGEFTLDDGAQRLNLWSAERDLLAATFVTLLLANCGPADSFKSKQEYFYSELRKLHARHAHDRLPVRVSRDDLLRTSLRATSRFTTAHWCRNFDICFAGEQGVDWGGVRREWFSLVCSALFGGGGSAGGGAGGGGLFAPLGGAQGLVHPNPNRDPSLKLKHYELAGKLVGKCLYESALGGAYRQLVRARFTRSFLAQIIGLRVHYKHFEQDDPELYISKIKYLADTDLSAAPALDLYFCDDEYDAHGQLKETRELIPNGSQIKVCNENKLQYLDALAQWRLAQRVRREVTAFLRGLAVLVPDNLLAVFDENELELLVCGTADISVPDWRAHAAVCGGGGAARDRVLRWFWSAVSSLSPAERARLLQFTTGAAHLPPGGFQDLNPRFQITAAPVFGALPTAHTCFNQLCLPDYDSYEQLVHALLWAINEGGEGFAMI